MSLVSAQKSNLLGYSFTIFTVYAPKYIKDIKIY